MRNKIVIVDDNDSLRTFVVQFLSKNGFEAFSCSTRSQSAISLIRTHDPDLIIVDMLLPATAGINLCTVIRKFSDKPILLMSSQIEDDDVKISGLRAGGDDYICKPFNFDLLLAQVKAHIRRYKGEFSVNQRHLLHFPGLEVDLSTQSVTSYGKEATLSAKEFQLLVLLAKNPNRIFHTEALYDLIWSDTQLGDLRTVMVHIYNLRKKIEKNPRKPLYIHTVRGSGYKFNGKVALQPEILGYIN
jgi:DNA-binding response OmpR family regulator